MPFTPPRAVLPDFGRPELARAPLARFEPVTTPGVAPDNYHATTIFPEYFKLAPGHWVLPPRSRMDCAVVRRPGDHLEAVEFRRLSPGDMVAVGRSEGGEEGIFVHTDPFPGLIATTDAFAFRTRRTRETSFSIDYDQLYELLEHECGNGFVAWVLGPAVAFDFDARQAFARLIKAGHVSALLAGNALATHDLEGAMFGTALGQELYSKRSVHNGHYHHLDALNAVRRAGSMREALQAGLIPDGIMRACLEADVPFVLAGSIRDDGPLAEVVTDSRAAQDAMRAQTQKATTVIAMATQLHAIAVGNMTPSYSVNPDGSLRPVYFYTVDMSEFAAEKLANRGSLTARAILTNVQDFVVTVERGLAKRRAQAG